MLVTVVVLVCVTAVPVSSATDFAHWYSRDAVTLAFDDEVHTRLHRDCCHRREFVNRGGLTGAESRRDVTRRERFANVQGAVGAGVRVGHHHLVTSLLLLDSGCPIFAVHLLLSKSSLFEQLFDEDLRWA